MTALRLAFNPDLPDRSGHGRVHRSGDLPPRAVRLEQPVRPEHGLRRDLPLLQQRREYGDNTIYKIDPTTGAVVAQGNPVRRVGSMRSQASPT